MTDPVCARPHALAAWGYDEYFQQRFDAVAEEADEPARVLRAELQTCALATAGGVVRLPLHSRLAAGGVERPTTGDFVVVRDVHVDAVIERRTAVVRASADLGRREQVLAANVDTVLVVEPLGERFRPRRLERLLVVAWQSGALPVVVLTKADQSVDVPGAIEAVTRIAPGVAVHAVSALAYDDGGGGVDALAEELAPATTAVMIGRSGAGKSTLANVLSGGEAGLETGSVRSDGKGRHTTVARELVRLAGGSLLIDTPGLRAIGLVDASEAIADAFGEVEQLSAECRFADCAHEAEPGCAVKAAIASGRLEAARLESYQRLGREQARLEAKHDPRLRAERAAAWRRITRENRQRSRP